VPKAYQNPLLFKIAHHRRALVKDPEDFWKRSTGVAAGEDRALGMDYRTSISTSSIQKIHDMGQITYLGGERPYFEDSPFWAFILRTILSGAGGGNYLQKIHKGKIRKAEPF